MINEKELKEKLLKLTIKGVEKFLKENPELVFYAFAYDCHTEHTQILLCLNTEEEFKKDLHKYQNGEYKHLYQDEESIRDLKYNTGNWIHRFENLFLLTQEKLDEIYDNCSKEEEWYKLCDKLDELFFETLLEFEKTTTFKNIPKTSDFVSYTINHHEDVDVALKRKNFI